jgi:hypothetical protein
VQDLPAQDRYGDGAWRALGQREDLDVDLVGAGRTEAVPALLAACLVADPHDDPPESLQRATRLTLSGRIGALCAIVARTERLSSLEILLRCPDDECGAGFAVELSLVDLQELADQAERELSVEVSLADRAPLRLRRPTGEDQRSWQRRRYATAAEAEREMLASLIDGNALPPDADLLRQVTDAMEDLDPLPSFRVVCRCISCDAEAEQPIDLELALLRRLQRHQRDLLGAIHRLAQRYGWSEDAVLALPSWRRDAYLALIDADAA